ncbi:uncharacterized protein LOC113295052 [Papaver somniferum]|uniref:uncharacterized protein LOC113295052 n=1 Tax=Papaver somniferum TaxID=3469 RepID=UPI000E6F7E9A|nr:uncharacterized protein LOC113295052 [Papaver somniferum]
MVIHNSCPGNKGNIWLFWNKSIAQPQVISVSSQMIIVSIGDVLVSGVHAHVKVVQMRFLWSERKLSDLNKPWIILGDFNAVLTQEEKVGGKLPNRNSMLDFNDCLDKCELLQAPRTGLQYTWSNCQHGSKRILCTLDRVVFNQKWLQFYGDWGYKVGMRVVSDHAPLLGGCASIPKPNNVPRNFQKMWLSHPNFLQVVDDCWAEPIVGDPAFQFLQKLKVLNKVLNEWNWNVFGNVQTKIKEAEIKVKEATQFSDDNPFDEKALNDLVMAENEYASREVQEKTLLRQKYRVKWIQEGSANTNFFHTIMKIRNSRNMISELEDYNGNVMTNQTQISDFLVQHFKKKFEFQPVDDAEQLLKVIPKMVTEEDQQNLDVIPEAEEIKNIIFEMDPESAPGPDGFSGIFYRSCWETIKYDLVAAIQSCWRRKFIPKGMNSSFLVLLPKTQGAKTANHFRPIGLSNVIFKIFTKVITKRMNGIMEKLISPQQVAYVKGRSIHEQVLLASELVNEMKVKRRGGNVGIKLDISQAYDSVSWEFLIKVLIQYGFSASWCDWIITLFKSARMSVMVNGGPCGFFQVERGLR